MQFGWKFCLLTFLAAGIGCRSYYDSSGMNGRLTTLDTTIAVDSSLVLIIEPYKSVIDIEMNEIISYSEIAITKNQPEGLLGNFVSDLVLYMCNTYYAPQGTQYDVVLLNNGGLRAALPKGLIRVGDVYSLMPFENETIILTLTGENFLAMVQYIIQSGGTPFAGMRISSRQLILDSLTINGEAFDQTKNYTVITSDYLATGGDKMSFFMNPVESKSLSVLIRDLIIQFLKEQNKTGIPIHPELDGRIVYE